MGTTKEKGTDPGELNGRSSMLRYGSQTISNQPFGVEILATRDGKVFGALPRTTRYTTREEALAHARKALVQQGRRYAKKYGAPV